MGRWRERSGIPLEPQIQIALGLCNDVYEYFFFTLSRRAVGFFLFHHHEVIAYSVS